MQTRFGIENQMTPMWQSAPNATKILRSQFGRKYDRREARNTCKGERPPRLGPASIRFDKP
jgi:hypothetical protein